MEAHIILRNNRNEIRLTDDDGRILVEYRVGKVHVELGRDMIVPVDEELVRRGRDPLEL